MAEREQGHRHSTESRDNWVAGWLQIVGQVGALGLSFIGIYSGYSLLLEGKSIAGFAFFIAAVATLIGTAIYRHKYTNPKGP